MKSPGQGLGRLAFLKAAVTPAFYAFVAKRLMTAAYLEMTAFAVSRAAGPGGGVGRGAIIRRTDGLAVGAGTVVRGGAELSGSIGADGLPTLILGRSVRVGRRVQLAAAPTERLRIGDYTSIHNGCIILGDVAIGRHCLLSNNIFISSSDHFSDVHPSWLIKDQDALVANTTELATRRSRPVVIDDDCWIGWGAVIRRGIHIGRGAIVGANSVVTRDIPPYAIHAGAPNRLIGSRLEFDPPERITSDDPAYLPYFYSGFDLRAARHSDSGGIPSVDSTACVVLKGGRWKTLRLAGRANRDRLPISVSVGGSDVGSLSFTPETTEHSLLLPGTTTTADRVPAPLREFTVVCLQAPDDRGAVGADYVIQMAALDV